MCADNTENIKYRSTGLNLELNFSPSDFPRSFLAGLAVTSLYCILIFQLIRIMEVARGGSFGAASKPSGEKKNESQSRISQLTGMVKSLYKNDFSRLGCQYFCKVCKGFATSEKSCTRDFMISGVIL